MGDFIEIIQAYNSNGGTRRLIRRNMVLQVWHDVQLNITVLALADGKLVYAEDSYEDVRCMLCGKAPEEE